MPNKDNINEGENTQNKVWGKKSKKKKMQSIHMSKFRTNKTTSNLPPKFWDIYNQTESCLGNVKPGKKRIF